MFFSFIFLNLILKNCYCFGYVTLMMESLNAINNIIMKFKRVCELFKMD